MTQFAFALIAEVALLTPTLIHASSQVPDNADGSVPILEKPENPFAASAERWTDWSKSGWSEEQWSPLIGVECWGLRCNSLRVLTYNAGIIQGSDQNGAYYDTDVFSDPSNWGGMESRMVCKEDYIVTRVHCDQAFCDKLKLRCTKLKHLNWCTNKTCGGNWRHWTEVLSNEDRGVDRSVRKCKPGTVMIGMECIDTYFCDRKRLLCEAITHPSRDVKNWWELYEASGGDVTDMYSVTQSSEIMTQHIFGVGEKLHLKVEGEIHGKIEMGKKPVQRKVKKEYKYSMYQELTTAFTESLQSEHIRLCEPLCQEQGKHAFLWMSRVDLVDDGVRLDGTLSDSIGFFQAIPGCLVQCVSIGKVPQCPPNYCEDDDCQCCSGGATDAVADGIPTCGFFSAAAQQHYQHLLFLLFPTLSAIFTGTLRRPL